MIFWCRRRRFEEFRSADNLNRRWFRHFRHFGGSFWWWHWKRIWSSILVVSDLWSRATILWKAWWPELELDGRVDGFEHQPDSILWKVTLWLINSCDVGTQEAHLSFSSVLHWSLTFSTASGSSFVIQNNHGAACVHFQQVDWSMLKKWGFVTWR